MKTYDLFFQRNSKCYVINVALDEIDKVILENFTVGAILTCIKEVK